jgi:hypothetical protein
MCHVWRTGQVHTGFWWVNLREEVYVEDVGIDGRLILKWIFEIYRRVWTGFLLLRIGKSGRLSWAWQWTFGFHKMREISSLSEELLASQEVLYSMEFFHYVDMTERQPVISDSTTGKFIQQRWTLILAKTYSLFFFFSKTKSRCVIANITYHCCYLSFA